jgi:hypothetical protein
MPLLRPRVYGGDPTLRGPKPIAAPAAKDHVADVLRWIPVEVIAVYKGIWSQMPADPNPHFWLAVVFIGVTFLWIAFATTNTKKQIAWRQAIVAAAAFMFWAAGTENEPIMHGVFGWWRDWMSAASLALGTLALPILDGILKRLRVPQD